MKNILIKALKKTFDMQKNDAKALAQTVEKIFDGKKEIEDMDIDKYARSLFYELQREHVLKIRREEVKEEGRKIRKYYWSFNEDMIKELANKRKTSEKYKIYKKIPKEAWISRSYSS